MDLETPNSGPDRHGNPERETGGDATGKVPVRDAATVVLVRDGGERPEILMGQRSAQAVFMPRKFVFPGGAVDPEDYAVELAGLPDPSCMARLQERAPERLAVALAAAAVRETWEETGLILGTPTSWLDPPAGWASFAGTGHRPSAAGFRYIFRAITPTGLPRRYDTRFFLADARRISGDPHNFLRASGELGALQWISLGRARSLDLLPITEAVLMEVAAILRSGRYPDAVPFHENGIVSAEQPAASRQ